MQIICKMFMGLSLTVLITSACCGENIILSLPAVSVGSTEFKFNSADDGLRYIFGLTDTDPNIEVFQEMPNPRRVDAARSLLDPGGRVQRIPIFTFQLPRKVQI